MMTTADLIETTYTRGLGTDGATATRVSADTVVCETCGCRLTAHDARGDAGPWFHYQGPDGRDARGCTIACSEAAHYLG